MVRLRPAREPASHRRQPLRAEEWAYAHWEVVEVGEREEVAENDYLYLLYAKKPDEGDFHARDFQARIARQDRVIALGRDPDAQPRNSGND